jgi:Glycerate kinase family
MLIFGIDKFMSECRAVVNFVGNAVATLFVGRWDGAVDSDRVRRVLDREAVPALPAELDGGTNPLSVESTELVGAYTGGHHDSHPVTAAYTVAGETAKLGATVGSHAAPVVGDATDPSPVLGDGSREEVVRVLLAPDKFKGSLTAAQVVHHLGSGLDARGIEHRGLPLADGGDGSVAAAVAAGFGAH